MATSGGDSRGRATHLGINTFNSVMINVKSYNQRTISHEIGHAVFKLFHPDGSLGAEEGYREDGLEDPTSEDFFNLMNSGFIYNTMTTHNIDEYKIRKYQWDIIHEGK